MTSERSVLSDRSNTCIARGHKGVTRGSQGGHQGGHNDRGLSVCKDERDQENGIGQREPTFIVNLTVTVNIGFPDHLIN